MSLYGTLSCLGKLTGFAASLIRAHDNVLQQDNFCLNIEFVSTNPALSRHSVNSSVLAEC